MTYLVAFIVCFIAGIGAGLGTGFAGMSAAAVISPMLITFLGMDPYMAVGIALASDVLASAIDHAAAANPDLPILAMTPRGTPITQARLAMLLAQPRAGMDLARALAMLEGILKANDALAVSLGEE